MENTPFKEVTFDRREGLADRTLDFARTAAIPWYIWCLAAAVTSNAFGGYWDISWHISIGRDTFWTPAHMAVYLAGVLAGVASGYTILAATSRAAGEARESSDSGSGFRRPRP